MERGGEMKDPGNEVTLNSSRIPIWPPIEEPIRSCVRLLHMVFWSKMGNVLAAPPSSSSSSSNVSSMPPPPPLTAPAPVEEKKQSSQKKILDNNPGTYEDLHKACKGRCRGRRTRIFCRLCPWKSLKCNGSVRTLLNVDVLDWYSFNNGPNFD